MPRQREVRSVSDQPVRGRPRTTRPADTHADTRPADRDPSEDGRTTRPADTHADTRPADRDPSEDGHAPPARRHRPTDRRRQRVPPLSSHAESQGEPGPKGTEETLPPVLRAPEVPAVTGYRSCGPLRADPRSCRPRRLSSCPAETDATRMLEPRDSRCRCVCPAQ